MPHTTLTPKNLQQFKKVEVIVSVSGTRHTFNLKCQRHSHRARICQKHSVGGN